MSMHRISSLRYQAKVSSQAWIPRSLPGVYQMTYPHFKYPIIPVKDHCLMTTATNRRLIKLCYAMSTIDDGS